MMAKEAFSRTTYTIYPDRIEYPAGFWTQQWRTVAFDQVTYVLLREGVLQRRRGAGTITLFSLQHGLVSLRNVPQPKEVWELIRSLAPTKSGPGETAPA